MLFEMFRHFITTFSPAFARLSLHCRTLYRLIPKVSQHSKKQTLERPADRKAKRPLRLEIVQAPWIVLQLQDRRLDLVEPYIRRQRAGQQSYLRTVRSNLIADIPRIQIIRWRDNLCMQPVDIVGVIHPERRLDDWQLNDKLDPR